MVMVRLPDLNEVNALLGRQGTDALLKDIGSALPYDNPEKTFETMIAWGRYAGLMDYEAKTRMVFVPRDDDLAP